MINVPLVQYQRPISVLSIDRLYPLPDITYVYMHVYTNLFLV